MPRHASHVLASWPAWCRRLAFARGRRAHNSRATPNGRSRGRCAPTAACKCAAASNPRKREPRSSPDRGTRALRVSSHRRARTPNSCRLPRVDSPAKTMPNDVARRARAVGARLRSCPSRARRVGVRCAALGVLGTLSARAARRRGRGGRGWAAVGRVEGSEGWRAGAGSPAGVRWGREQAGARRGGRRRARVGHIE